MAILKGMNKFLTALVSSATIAALSLSVAPAASAQSSNLFGMSSSSKPAPSKPSTPSEPSKPSKPSMPSTPNDNRAAIIELFTEYFTAGLSAQNATTTKELSAAAQNALKDVDSDSVFWIRESGFYKSIPSDSTILVEFMRFPIDEMVAAFESSGKTIDELKKEIQENNSADVWEDEGWEEPEHRDVGVATVDKNGYLYIAGARHWSEYESPEEYNEKMARFFDSWEEARS